jgi:hypothetical protein
LFFVFLACSYRRIFLNNAKHGKKKNEKDNKQTNKKIFLIF